MIEIDAVDLHSSGEPVRIVTSGYPRLEGNTILEKKAYAEKHHDMLRQAVMLEPRGHAEMFGMIPVEPCSRNAAIGALYIHTTGYSMMSGHGLIAFCRWALETGRVPMTEPECRFGVELPCGVVEVICHVHDGKVVSTAFDSVPAFLDQRDVVVEVPALGEVKLDIAFGGAYYAIVSCASIGISFDETRLDELVRITTSINDAARASVTIQSLDGPQFAYLFGTMLIDDAPIDQASFHLCIFADRQLDRSPTGGGVVSRMARDHARGHIGPGVRRRFYGPTQIPFEAEIVKTDSKPFPNVTVRVSGSASFVGRSTFIIDPEDCLTHGFTLPKTYRDLREQVAGQAK